MVSEYVVGALMQSCYDCSGPNVMNAAKGRRERPKPKTGGWGFRWRFRSIVQARTFSFLRLPRYISVVYHELRTMVSKIQRPKQNSLGIDLGECAISMQNMDTEKGTPSPHYPSSPRGTPQVAHRSSLLVSVCLLTDTGDLSLP